MSLLEKEHPNAPLGTVKGHKTTKKQQRFFGIARGMQKGDTSKSYSPAAAKLSRSLSGKEVHKIASKPKSGFRRSPRNSESALDRVMQMVAEVEVGPGHNLPSHVSADNAQFEAILARLDEVEKRLNALDPRTVSSAKPGYGLGAEMQKIGYRS